MTVASQLVHPEHVGGNRLWMDGTMSDLIHRLHHGDPTKGWEGDERLCVYWNAPTERWEVWRLEDDNEYRMVCRSGPGVPFDERLIENLVAWDVRRRTKSLHDEISDHNEKVRTERRERHLEYIREEAAPRLQWALRRDGA